MKLDDNKMNKQFNIDDIDQVKLSDFKEVNVSPDGNCFFRALGHLHHQDVEKHAELRASIVEHMINNKQDYEAYVDGDWDDHIKVMSEASGHIDSWATDAETMAASHYLNTVIVVFMVQPGETHKQRFGEDKFDATNPCKNPVLFLKLQSLHFTALVPKTTEEPTTTLRRPTTPASFSPHSFLPVERGSRQTLQRNALPVSALPSYSQRHTSALSSRVSTVTSVRRFNVTENPPPSPPPPHKQFSTQTNRRLGASDYRRNLTSSRKGLVSQMVKKFEANK